MIEKIEFDGLDELARDIQRAADARKMLARAMFSEAQKILNESKKIVPVDTGVLKNSGAVSEPKTDPNGVEVEISYGGAAAPYALIVHEDPTAQHAPGKSFKYLEIPFMQAREEFVRNIKIRFLSWMKTGA